MNDRMGVDSFYLGKLIIGGMSKSQGKIDNLWHGPFKKAHAYVHLPHRGYDTNPVSIPKVVFFGGFGIDFYE